MSTPDARRAATFVLVHGTFHGGWCWAKVRRTLQASGHQVFTPSQTGLGDRKHLLSRDITMETFVQDIVNVVEAEELDDVILVGHSYGTRTVCGVADRIPERLRHLVFLDGAFPFDGLSRLEGMTPEARQGRIAAAQEFSDGLGVPPPHPQRFGITDPVESDWIGRRMTPQPLSVEASGLSLSNPLGNGLPGTYIRCTEPPMENLDESATYARHHLDWDYIELATHHDAMISASSEVCSVLERIAHDAPTTAQPPRHRPAGATTSTG